MGSPRNRKGTRTIAILAMVMLLAFASVLGVAWFQKASAVTDDTYEYLELFNQVLSIVQRDYVEDVSTKDLMYGAIRGMLMTLDPHSQFYSKEDYQAMREDISGEFGGLGIQITVRKGKLTVIAPLEDTPAWDAGIKAGDWITAIDGEATGNMNIHEAVSKMRGPIGEPVTISVLREGFDEPEDFEIVRGLIEVKSVRDYKLMQGDIGYVRISNFTDHTYDELKAAMDKIKADAPAGFKGIVLDLRGNPGGPLNQAVEVADMFLSEGLIVSVRGRNESQPPRYAGKAGTIDDVPMVALVNQHSASASEIVAGALKDHGRALIIGKTTFGKGSVQQLRRVKDSAGLKLTTAYYYTPSERITKENGITPDIEVEALSPEQKLKLKEMEEEKQGKYFREKDFKGHIPKEDVSKRAKPQDGDSAGEEGGVGEDLLPKEVGDDTDDYQLQRALDVLRSFEIFQAVLKRKG